MEVATRLEIDIQLRKNLTNQICGMGAGLAHQQNLITHSQHISKKKMRESLAFQRECLAEIEKIKDYLLTLIKVD